MGTFNSPQAVERRRLKNLAKKVSENEQLIKSFRQEYPNLAEYNDVKIIEIIEEIDYGKKQEMSSL